MINYGSAFNVFRGGAGEGRTTLLPLLWGREGGRWNTVERGGDLRGEYSACEGNNLDGEKRRTIQEDCDRRKVLKDCFWACVSGCVSGVCIVAIVEGEGRGRRKREIVASSGGKYRWSTRLGTTS